MFTEHTMHSEREIYWLLGGVLFGRDYFLSPSDRRGELVESWLSFLNRALLPDGVSQAEHEAALLHFYSGLTPWSVCLAEMISNRDDFSTLCMKMECYLPLSGHLPIYLT